MESTLIAYWGHIAPYMPDLDTVVSIVAIVALISCWPLIALGGLGVLNLYCRRKLKSEGVTDEDMAELQRRMLGYVAKDPKEVERLYRCMQVWGGNKAANRRGKLAPVGRVALPVRPTSAVLSHGHGHLAPHSTGSASRTGSSLNVIDLKKWRAYKATEAAE